MFRLNRLLLCITNETNPVDEKKFERSAVLFDNLNAQTTCCNKSKLKDGTLLLMGKKIKGEKNEKVCRLRFRFLFSYSFFCNILFFEYFMCFMCLAKNEFLLYFFPDGKVSDLQRKKVWDNGITKT